MPASAPRPVPTITAAGVASPIAHGQAMTTTLMKAVSASVNRGSGPTTNHMANVPAASSRTTGTKTSAMRSARCWIGALLPCARRTASTIRASAVSRPTRVARITNVPVALSVAPTTSTPGPTSNGTGSPVSMLASTADEPSTTTPSTGTFSPGRTRSRSPTATDSSGTSASCSPSTLRATVGWRPISRRIAPAVLALARPSSQRPSRTRPMMIADASKYVSGWSPASWIASGNSVTPTLYSHAAVVPTAISVSMLAVPWRAARIAAR